MLPGRRLLARHGGSATLAAVHVACRSCSCELAGPHLSLRVHWLPATRAQALQISTSHSRQLQSVCFMRSSLQAAHRRDFLVEVLLQLLHTSLLAGLICVSACLAAEHEVAVDSRQGILASSLMHPPQSQLAQSLHTKPSPSCFAQTAQVSSSVSVPCRMLQLHPGQLGPGHEASSTLRAWCQGRHDGLLAAHFVMAGSKIAGFRLPGTFTFSW